MARRFMQDQAPQNSIQATALVHEVYLRLVDVTRVEWQARAQFFGIAAQMMRRILVDAARKHGSRRRDGTRFTMCPLEAPSVSCGSRG